MKVFIYILLISVSFALLTAQTAVVVSTPDGTSKVFNTIPSAIEGAMDGDIIYLPAGSFDANNIIINKRLHIIGAGYNSKVRGAEGVTYLTGTLSIVRGATGGSLQGVYVSGEIRFGTSLEDVDVSNYVISRCYFNILLLGYAWNGFNNNDNILITENIVEGALYGAYATNVKITKNIFRQTDVLGRLVTHFQNAIFSNNIFIPLDHNPFNGVEGCIFQNNIITKGNFGYVNLFKNNQYLNNLYTYIDGLNPYGVSKSEGNVRIDFENIFVNYKGEALSFDDDYHLTQDAINAIKATDGGQVGIYGTDAPFKDFGIPVNPFIKEGKISTMTNSKGQLKINFKVEAQTK